MWGNPQVSRDSRIRTQKQAAYPQAEKSKDLLLAIAYIIIIFV
jgi:hypothetical protein